MAYQSKTWSLSDEVVEAVEAARLRGETPNQFFKRLIKEWEYACREATIHDCDDANLDATGPELSSGKGKATVETRGIRPKGDSKR